MAIPLAEQIIALCKEGLSAYKTFLATRQEAYNRQQDKQQVRAIEAAEKLIFEVDEIVLRLKIRGLDKEEAFTGLLRQFVHFRKRFFHYH